MCFAAYNPVPDARISDGKVVNFPDVRSWEVEYAPHVAFYKPESYDCSFLVLSGGGSKGAFGAGFLNGWTATGIRPQFKLRLHNQAVRDEVSFHYISIPYNFVSEGEEMFDVDEMKRMYDLGYRTAVSENPSQTEIPLFRRDRQWLWTPESQ